MDRERKVKITEMRNPASLGIDMKTTREILEIINREDQKVPFAVRDAIPQISVVVDTVVSVFRNGGRLFYVGAGTSGRLGVLDASECPPTYGVDSSMVVGLLAGGDEALRDSVMGDEDNESWGEEALVSHSFSSRDIVIGISANGDAPYVLGALKYAKSIRSERAMISSNYDARAFAYVDEDKRIVSDVGPEVILGSTRMKSGSAQKLILNMITTASMIKLGKVYDNYMVDLKCVNNKLVGRSISMISEISGCTEEEASRLFEESGRSVKTAVVMALTGKKKDEALSLLEKGEGSIRRAVKIEGLE